MNNILEKLPPVERLDINGRWYSPIEQWWKDNGKLKDRTYSPSVTTYLDVMSKGIGWDLWLGNANSYREAMDYSRERARIGTVVHEMVQSLLLGDEIELKDDDKYKKWYDPDNEEVFEITPEIIKYILSFQAFYEDYRLKPLGTEICIWHPGLDWAGTADFVGTLTNPKTKAKEYWLLDWKTGKPYQNHALQLTSYKLLWDSYFPDIELNIAAVYFKSTWRKKPNYKFQKFEPQPEEWNRVVKLWKWANGDPKPKFPQELPNTIKIMEEENGI